MFRRIFALDFASGVGDQPESIGNADWLFGRELDWLCPAIVLTLGMTAFALIGTPTHSGILPVLLLLPQWMAAAAAIAGIFAFIAIFGMMLRGIEGPFSHCIRFVRQNLRLLQFSCFAMLLAGLNMIAFMWVKPLLNYLVPFWADPYLAQLDRAVLSIDPWRALQALNTWPLAVFYHQAWFASVIAALLLALLQAPSAAKSALLLTYFLLWSIFGPLVHSLLPAGGPIFYSRLGYGGTFQAITLPTESKQVADYLWEMYVYRTFGGGAGISAMPSLHVATTAWAVMVVRQYAPRLFIAALLFGILIFLLSIGLGWHYASDGIVGAAGAWLIQRTARRVLSRRRRLRDPAYAAVRAATTG